MLVINDLSVRVAGRLLIEHASAHISDPYLGRGRAYQKAVDRAIELDPSNAIAHKN